MEQFVLLALCVVAGVLAVVEIAQHGVRTWLAWAVLALAVFGVVIVV